MKFILVLGLTFLLFFGQVFAVVDDDLAGFDHEEGIFAEITGFFSDKANYLFERVHRVMDYIKSEVERRQEIIEEQVEERRENLIRRIRKRITQFLSEIWESFINFLRRPFQETPLEEELNESAKLFTISLN